ncbi:uncharacterized protein PgNI_06750 [Pyricularia grisea]|uniref:DUF3328 domain-containing protein n=1 Tax=Pyricularia grisea TaxID=148305 RepID=A0A6P8B337_PYRGI|nr:uncharacterized protein PgNI_06750 [Pyricularia grisea]TLD09219.1 hypothetical protein PgNI_06750 [Pyricularia grisea]
MAPLRESSDYDEEVEEGLLGRGPLNDRGSQCDRNGKVKHWCKWIIVCIFSATLIALIFTQVHSSGMLKSSSPSLSSPTIQTFETVFPRFGALSIYSGGTNGEKEEAWGQLLETKVPKWLSVSDKELKAMGKDSTHSDGYPWHRNEDGTVEAVTELWHQLHCLDLIRKYINRDNWDYSKNHAWQWGPYRLRQHVDHCVENLRVAIQCTGDMTPVLEYENDDQVWLDFETKHTCRKY